MATAKSFEFAFDVKGKVVHQARFVLGSGNGKDLTRFLQAELMGHVSELAAIVKEGWSGDPDANEELPVKLKVHLADARRDLTHRESLQTLITLEFDEHDEALSENGGEALFFSCKMGKAADKVVLKVLEDKAEFETLTRDLSPKSQPGGTVEQKKEHVNMVKQEPSESKPPSSLKSSLTTDSSPTIKAEKAPKTPETSAKITSTEKVSLENETTKQSPFSSRIPSPSKPCSKPGPNDVFARLEALEQRLRYATETITIASPPERADLSRLINHAFNAGARDVCVQLQPGLHYRLNSPVHIPNRVSLTIQGTASKLSFEQPAFLQLHRFAHVCLKDMDILDETNASDVSSCLIAVKDAFAVLELIDSRVEFQCTSAVRFEEPAIELSQLSLSNVTFQGVSSSSNQLLYPVYPAEVQGIVGIDSCTMGEGVEWASRGRESSRVTLDQDRSSAFRRSSAAVPARITMEQDRRASVAVPSGRVASESERSSNRTLDVTPVVQPKASAKILSLGRNLQATLGPGFAPSMGMQRRASSSVLMRPNALSPTKEEAHARKASLSPMGRESSPRPRTKTNEEEMKKWSEKDVAKFLKEYNMFSLVSVFQTHEINGKVLLEMHSAFQSGSCKKLPSWVKTLPATSRKRLQVGLEELLSPAETTRSFRRASRASPPEQEHATLSRPKVPTKQNRRLPRPKRAELDPIPFDEESSKSPRPKRGKAKLLAALFS